MDPLLLSAFCFYAFSATITPGPNNIMMMSSGARFGFNRSWPHMLGVAFGFPLMVLAAGAGLGTLLQQSPFLHGVLRWVGAALMLWIALQIAAAPPFDEKKTTKDKNRPLRLYEAVLFQWVNPKAWVGGLGAIAAYTTPAQPFMPQLATIACVFALVGLPSAMVWTAFGKGIRRFLGTEKRQRFFNLGMGILLALSVIPIILDALKAHNAAP